MSGDAQATAAMQPARHPLAEPAQVRRIVAGWPAAPAEKRFEELAGWLAALNEAGEIAPSVRWEVLGILREAGQSSLDASLQAHLDQWLAGSGQHRRLPAQLQDYYRNLAGVSQACLLALQERLPGSEGLLPHFAEIAALALSALRAQIKWAAVQYLPLPERIWARMGAILGLAERGGVAEQMVALLPGGRQTSPLREYTLAVAFAAADVDGLRPLEMELADRLLTEFGGFFELVWVADPACSYWLDITNGREPERFTKAPQVLTAGLRFFKAGRVGQGMQQLLEQVTLDGGLPSHMVLGEGWPLSVLKRVLQHLVEHFARTPPRRRHMRFPLHGQLRIAPGYAAALALFQADAQAWPEALSSETWEIENASQGGCAALVRGPVEEAAWLEIGALLVSQPVEGGPSLLGIVRRLRREADGRFRVGIETLGRQVEPRLFVPMARSGQAAGARVTGLLIRQEASAASVSLLLPKGSYALREVLAYVDADDQLCRLRPDRLLDSGTDYELIRYRRST